MLIKGSAELLYKLFQYNIAGFTAVYKNMKLNAKGHAVPNGL